MTEEELHEFDEESDSESDELLNLLMQDPVKQEEERLAQEEESQRRRQELEKDAAISSFLQALKKRRCENGIDKDSPDAGREEQEEAGRNRNAHCGTKGT